MFLFKAVANHLSFKLSGVGFVWDATELQAEALMRVSSTISYSFLSVKNILFHVSTEVKQLVVTAVLCIWGKYTHAVTW